MIAMWMGCAALPAKVAPTAPGAVVVEWTARDATRRSFAAAEIGPATATSVVLRQSEPGMPPLALSAHVELADVDFVEDHAPVHQRAPVSIRVTVEDNGGWALTGRCSDGPNYQMPALAEDGTYVTPIGMVESCWIERHYRSYTGEWRLGVDLSVRGDGRIEATGMTVEPE